MAKQPVVPTKPGVQFILWEDLVVIIDDGDGQPSDYEAIRRKFLEQRARFKAGAGCLTIVPVDAKPPSQPARKAMSAALENAPLRCLCWLVEGAGFQGAMVRAVITGLRVVGRFPYPTHVTGDLEEAVLWILPKMEGGTERIERAHEAVAAIRAQREANALLSS
jgi:hypothetical protein